MSVLFLYYNFFYTVCAHWTISFLLPTPLRLQTSVQCFECSQTHSFQYASHVSCTNCSDVKIYAVIYSSLSAQISSEIFLLQSVSSFYEIPVRISANVRTYKTPYTFVA